jgi:predicted DNA-binding protein
MRALKKKPIQIYIEPRQDKVLDTLSKRKGISKAAIIRESVERYLKELPVEEDSALRLIGLGSSGKGDLSIKHDKYLAIYC